MSEEPVIIPGEIALRGSLHSPDGAEPAAGLVVCHPHPRYGGSMENNVVMALVHAALKHGIAALRFNFRGVGGSGGSFDDGDGEVDDVRSALAYLTSRSEIDRSRLALAGFSFGAMMAMGAVDERVRALMLVSPPMQWLGDGAGTGWRGPMLLVAGDADPICPAAMLTAYAGETGARASVTAGADHSWWGHEAELERLAADFFTETLTVGVTRL